MHDRIIGTICFTVLTAAICSVFQIPVIQQFFFTLPMGFFGAYLFHYLGKD